jgi:fibronectin-binding autotransporter adhesin
MVRGAGAGSVLPVVALAGLLSLFAGMPHQAFAANECGVGTNVTCTSGGNPFATGITYANANQTVNLATGVSVASGGNVGINLTGTGTQTLNVASGVTVATTGAGADGIDVAGLPTGAILVQAGGSIVTTQGNDAWGFGLFGQQSITATVGSVTVAGNGTVGVWATAFFGPVSITTTGAILGQGNNTANIVNGILAQNTSGAGANGAVTVDSRGGSVTLTGTTTSHAITATSTNGVGGGAVAVTTANVSTAAASAFGINATTTGAGANGLVTVDTTAGTVRTTGASARAINATSSGGAVVVDAGNIETDGASAIGIFAQGTSVDVTAANIDTDGNNAHGVQASTQGLVQIDGRGGTISTDGTNARGITIDKTGAGAVEIQAGTLATIGQNAQGIHVVSGTFGVGNGGAVSISAHSISTTGLSNSVVIGDGADAIEVITVGSGVNGRVVIDTSVGALPATLGSINTTGDRSRGIQVQSGHLDVGGPIGGGSINVTAGNVSTEGDSAGAIDLETFGVGADGAITVNVLGTVSTKGDGPGGVDAGPARGINAVSWGAGGEVRVTARDISTEGDQGGGIFAQSEGGAVIIDTTGGTVTTKGSGASGVAVGTPSGDVSIMTGDIHTEGGFTSIGVLASNTGPDSDMTIDTRGGTITTLGTVSHGINAITGSFGGTSNAGTLTIRAGNISAANSSGIVAGALDGEIVIEVYGAVSTGAVGSQGISVGADGATTTSINVIGSVNTLAAAAHGIVVSGPPGAGSTSIVVGGVVRAQGATADGIRITGINDSVTVNAGGSVSGTTAGIQVQQLGPGSVANNGTVTGTGGPAVRFLGNFVSTFTNDGTVNGNVLLGANNDTAVLGTNSTVVGNIDGEAGNDTLRFAGAGSNAEDVSTFLNFEAFEKIGASDWTLTGTNATTAAFTVNAGRLAVNGSLPNAPFTVNAGATLGGTGTVGTTNIMAGGIFAPGNSVGTINVNGNVSFAAGSTFEVEIDASGSDLIAATGTATLLGGTVSVIATPGGVQFGTPYAILTAAGGVTGTFAAAISSSAFISPTLIHNPANVQLVLERNLVGFCSVAQTFNQCSAGNAAERLAFGNPIFNAILALDAAAARAAFDQLSGEVHASFAGLLVEDSRFLRDAATDRVRAAFATDTMGTAPVMAYGPDGIQPASADTELLAVWADAFGSWGDWNGDGNATGLNRALGGVLIGADGMVADNFRLGILSGYSHTSFSVGARNSSGYVSSYHLGAFGGGDWGRFGLTGGAAYSWHNVKTSRSVAFPGFTDTLSANYNAGTFQAFGEASYSVALSGVTLEPFAGLAHVSVSTRGIVETGGAAALTAAPSTTDITFGTLGLRASAPLPFEGIDATIGGMIGWRHAFGSVPPQSSFAFAGGTAFPILGVPIARDVAVVEAKLDFRLSSATSFGVSYAGQFGSGMFDHSANARLAVRF